MISVHVCCTFLLLYLVVSRGQQVNQSNDDIESFLKSHQVKLANATSKRSKFGPSYWIGAFPPVGTEESRGRFPRSQSYLHTDEICQTNRRWKQINETVDMFGQNVRIVHSGNFKQFVYVYECTSEGNSCLGLRKRYKSSCESRSGWAFMLHSKANDSKNLHDTLEWGYVSVPHHCACRLIRSGLHLFYGP